MSVFLTRVVLHNYKSIAACDVRLGALNYLVGPNGAGKSNFVDALHLVADALDTSLQHAVGRRLGLENLLHRNAATANYLGVRLEFILPDGQSGEYAFTLRADMAGETVVEREACQLNGPGGHFFQLADGRLSAASVAEFPVVDHAQLALVRASGVPAFRPVFDALRSIGVFHWSLRALREPQQPQDGRSLKEHGENIASVIAFMKENSPEEWQLVQRYLTMIDPTVDGVEPYRLGPMETVQFQQSPGDGGGPRFLAHAMSEGSLRAFATLVALFSASTANTRRLVCLEEPETALHPAAFAALREAIARTSELGQVVVTSHSPDLLDDFGIAPEALLMVTSQGGATRIAPLEAASRTAITARLFSAGELLRLNQLAPDRAQLLTHDAPPPSLWSPAFAW